MNLSEMKLFHKAWGLALLLVGGQLLADPLNEWTWRFPRAGGAGVSPHY